MNLFLMAFKKDEDFFMKENIKVVFSGRRDRLSKELLKAMDDFEKITRKNTLGTFNICLNYGGRAEIVDACNKIIKKGIKKVDEDTFSNYLYNKLPDIDFCIRTSGELRISNFMLWQLSYAELYFPNCYFPDFDEKEYDRALEEFSNRNRRFGSIKDE